MKLTVEGVTLSSAQLAALVRACRDRDKVRVWGIIRRVIPPSRRRGQHRKRCELEGPQSGGLPSASAGG